MNERVMIFIDGSNLYFSIKELAKRFPLPGSPIDYHKLSLMLVKNRKLIRTYYYTGLHNEKQEPEKFHKQQQFLGHLQEAQCLMLRFGKLIRRGDSLIEKGVDVLLAVDLMRLARLNSYDTAILITGDGDFVEAIKDVQDQGKQVELAYIPYGLASSLKTACDRGTEITPMMLNMCSTRTLPEMAAVK